MSTLDCAGRVALVTGGGAGIGLATARLLLDRGASVALVDRDGPGVEAAAARLGHRALAVEADVTDAAAVRAAAAATVEAFGAIDVVIANAGITPPPATLRRARPEDFAQVLAVNVTGVLHTVQACLEEVIAHRGHVVVVASAAAYSPPVGGAAYMVSKSAVEVLARALRLELAGHGVTVTTAAFGLVDTQLARATLDEHEVGRMIDGLLPAPLRRRISAEDAARVLVLATERRSARVTAPLAWAPLGILRGIITPPLDALLVRSGRLDPAIRLLEAPGRPSLGREA